MLEAAGFDFRSRQPQQLVVKLSQACGFTKEVCSLAYAICMDLYSTFAPLKQTTWTMAIACVELAARLRPNEVNVDSTLQEGGMDYEKGAVDRAQVLETLLDLLDMYTHFRSMTTVGREAPLDTFIGITIQLKQECEAKGLHRFTESPSLIDAPVSPQNGNNAPTNGVKRSPASRSGASPASPAQPSGEGRSSRATTIRREDKRDRNANKDSSSLASPAVASPSDVRPGQRGQAGTVRFMMDNRRAAEENDEVDRYYRDEYEEVEDMEEVVDEPNVPAPRNNVNNRSKPKREEERNGTTTRERDRLRGREREDPRDRDRDRRAAGGHRESRHRDEEYDRATPRHRERERERGKDREKDRERERDRERDRERERDRDYDRRDRHREDYHDRRHREREREPYEDRRR